MVQHCDYAQRWMNLIPSKRKSFLSSTSVHIFPWGLTSLLFNGDLGLLHLEVERPRRQDDQSPTAKVKNERGYTAWNARGQIYHFSYSKSLRSFQGSMLTWSIICNINQE